MPDDLTARITDILTEHRAVDVDHMGDSDVIECGCGWFYEPEDHATHVAAILAAAAEQHYRPRVETVEQLDALPSDAVVLDEQGWAWQRHTDPDVGVWIPAAFNSTDLVDDEMTPELPAVLLWSPGGER